MNTRIRLLAFVMIVLLASCSRQRGPFEPERASVVVGSVTTADGAPFSLQFIMIRGTNFLAVTDSTGRFAFFDLPAGNHTLSMADTAVVATVTPGDTTDLGTIVLPAAPAMPRRLVVECRMMDNEDSLVILEGEGTILSDAQAVRIAFRVFEESSLVAVACTVRILQNNVPVWEGPSGKRWSITNALTTTGADTFTVLAGGTERVRMIVLERAKAAEAFSPYVLITTGGAVIGTSRWSSGYSGTHSLPVGPDTFWVLHRDWETVDWDLYLINDQTGDTCYWGNPSPGWNADGSGPMFSGDQCGPWADQLPTISLTCSSFSPDRIEAVAPAAGTYSVYVYFRGGPDDTATPCLSIELGIDSRNQTILRYYERVASAPLRRGEMWYAGKILVSQMRYDPRGELVIAAVPKG